MKRLGRFALAAGALAALSASAWAGTVVSATGPFLVKGKEVRLEAGKTLPLQKGDVVDTQGAKLTWRSDTGDDVTLEPGSSAREEGMEGAASGLFVRWGVATGTLSDKTQLGASAGWASAPLGGRTRVVVDVARSNADKVAYFRSVEGGAWVRYRAFDVWLLQAQSVTLTVEPKTPANLRFETKQQNVGDVEVRKTLAAGNVIVAFVPKATIGWFSDEEQGKKTGICNDVNSLKTAKIRVLTRFKGRPENRAEIGPGTCALIDNETGAIQVLFLAVEFQILERAITLTTEFSTLAQSNFADVQ